MFKRKIKLLSLIYTGLKDLKQIMTKKNKKYYATFIDATYFSYLFINKIFKSKIKLKEVIFLR
jgi:hypothetical protein